MFFSLELLPARKGDCLLLHFGQPNAPGLGIIDGGPRQVYGPHLKPRLDRIRTARGLTARKPLTVDLVMVSHLDDDHIRGILDLTNELITSQEEHKPQRVQVLSLWHNSFENVIGSRPDELIKTFQGHFGAASSGG